MDVLLSFPSLILGMIMVALLGSSVTNLITAIALSAIAPFARIARAPVLVLKERAFIEAGRALGFSHSRILLVHVLPSIVNDLLVMGTLWMATAVRTEASLSFIGLGVKPPTPTWGGMMRDGFENILDSAWLCIWPGLAILALVLGLNLVGDGLCDATDPKANAQ
jgi:peptide/nickel transport system permease protein